MRTVVWFFPLPACEAIGYFVVRLMTTCRRPGSSQNPDSSTFHIASGLWNSFSLVITAWRRLNQRSTRRSHQWYNQSNPHSPATASVQPFERTFSSFVVFAIFNSADQRSINPENQSRRLLFFEIFFPNSSMYSFATCLTVAGEIGCCHCWNTLMACTKNSSSSFARIVRRPRGLSPRLPEIRE